MFKKLGNFIKKNYKYLIFCLVFLLLNFCFVYQLRAAIGKKIIVVSVLLLVQISLCALCSWLKKKKNWQPHQLFLLFAITIGIMFSFALPPGTAPDEPNHFKRAYEISEGHFISAREDGQGEGGDILPTSVKELFKNSPFDIKYRDYAEIFSAADQASAAEFSNFGNTALYSPIVYLPQATGILIGRILHLPMFLIFMLARFFNLAVWILLGYYAVKKIPFGKNVLLLILFMPISLQAAASCQADAITNASAIALFAFVLSKIKIPQLLSKKDTIIAVVLALLVSMSKIVYLPLCFLLLLLPQKCFSSKKDKAIKLGILLAAIVVINLIWLAISAGFLVEFNEGVDSGAQVKYILSNPIRYFFIAVRTLTERGTFFFFSFMGSNLAHFNIGLSEPYFIFFSFFILYAYLQENKREFQLSNWQKISIATIAIVCLALIFTSLYVQWTPLGNSLIDGIQGRYFIPLALPLLFLLSPIATRRREDFDLYVFAMISAIDTYALVAITGYYLS